MSASPESLNVVALISGGKDSMYSLLHCRAQRHKVVALANLYPANQAPNSNGAPEENLATAGWDEDVDSFMYQTAGHNLIHLYSDALRLPLYRQEITGEARDSSLSYSGHDEDETEALVPLLNKVKEAHPEVNAVCSGAILSTYQRTRVESVAIRLGLVPLAFLWQYPSLPPLCQGGLLEDMGRAGFDVRIIKVASGGLTSRFLWCDLTSSLTRRNLVNALRPFGGNVLGEGGEYETMVVCGPSNLRVIERQTPDNENDVQSWTKVCESINQFWTGRIEVPLENRRIVLGSGSETASLQFKHDSGRISDSEAAESNGLTFPVPLLRLPNIWDKPFHQLIRQARGGPLLGFDGCMDTAVENVANIAKLAISIPSTTNDERTRSGDTESSSTIPDQSDTGTQHAISSLDLERLTHSTQLDNFLVVANLTGLSMGNTVQEQMKGIKQQLLNKLQEVKRPTSSIVFTTILLTSMSDFATVNHIYGELFEKPNPPARVTVGCPLPDGMKLMMSVTINMGDNSNALHVQSRSYWAPANIGPYSQAIRMPLSSRMPVSDAEQPSLVFIAGQIPLVPATMQLLAPSASVGSEPPPASSPLRREFLPRCCFSLQHLWRIGREMNVYWWTGAVAFVAKGADESSKAGLAWTVWEKAHARELWGYPKDTEYFKEPYEVEQEKEIHLLHSEYMSDFSSGVTEEHHLPDFDKVTSMSQGGFAIPRDKIGPHESEQASDVPGFFAVEVDELPRGSDIEWQSLGVSQGKVTQILTSSSYGGLQLEVSSCIIGSTGKCVSFVSIPFHSDSDKTGLSRSLSRATDWLRNVSDPSSEVLLTIYTPEITVALDTRAHFIPCHAVWGSEARRLSAGIVAHFKIRDGMES